MKKKNLKKLIILNIPYFVIGLVATNIGEACHILVGENKLWWVDNAENL